MQTETVKGAPGRRMIVAGVVAGMLWVATGTVSHLLTQGSGTLARLGSLMPAVIPSSIWNWPVLWAPTVIGLGTVGVALASVGVASLIRRGAASAGLIGTWFSVVVAASAVGAAIDVFGVLADLPLVGLLAFSSSFGDVAAIGALWGLIAGWVPALVAVRAPRTDPRAPRSRAWLPIAAGAVLVLFVVVGLAGARVARTDNAQQAAVAGGTAPPQGGALPDPYAQGNAVPTVAPTSDESGSTTCTPAVATLLKGDPDAATGHRSLAIRLMNFSDQPCTIEGYPDVAFGDQNSHDLAVAIEHGGSFMTTDPGAQPVEVPPGGTVIASLGWDANATAGALVTTTLYAAPLAGMDRGSWPLDLDIVEGSTVSVTAWQPDTTGGGSSS